MKSFGKILKKILTAAVTVALCASTLALTALSTSAAEAADPFTNLFDKSTALAGIVNAANGQETPSSQYYTSAYIKVKKGDIIRFGPAVPGQAYYLHGYGSATEITKPMVKADALSSVQDMPGNPDGNATLYKIYAYTVPEGVTGVRIVCSSAMASVFTITKNQQLNADKYFDYWRAPERAEAFASGGGYVADIEKSPLVGRSVIFMGDSITHANRETSVLYQGWAGRIGQTYDMSFHNAGKNGSTVAEYSGLSQIEDQINNAKYDFVIMHGGINDFAKGIARGTLTAADDFDGPYDKNTFAGGLENLFMKVKAKYTDAKFGYIINYRLSSDLSKLTSYGVSADNFSEYANVIKAACDKWGIPYLDLSTDEIKTALKVDTTEFLPDYLHLNGKGYDLVTPYIASFMESLAPEWIPSDEPTDDPADDPTDDPSDDPTDDPADDPTDDPADDPTDDPADDPVDDPTDKTENNDDTTKAPDTTATPANGCGGSLVGLGVLTATAAAACAVTLKKKKEND